MKNGNEGAAEPKSLKRKKVALLERGNASHPDWEAFGLGEK